MAERQLKQKRPNGRPTKYSEKLAIEICERLIGGDSLSAICREADMPAISSIYLWMQKHKEFSEMYARAKQDQADTLADEILHIADTETDPNRARVRIDARKWIASKLKPRVYADRIKQEVDTNFTVVIGEKDAAGF